jgi:hypothetical protein
MYVRLALLCCCALAAASCSLSRPPQTGFYCVDIPAGRSADAGRYVQKVADRLRFSVSEAQFPSEEGAPNHVWEVYGKGVSMFVDTAMKDGPPDRYGNRKTTFNPNRLGFNVAKTGWWQRVRFEDVVIAARDAARQFGFAFSKGNPEYGCSS